MNSEADRYTDRQKESSTVYARPGERHAHSRVSGERTRDECLQRLSVDLAREEISLSQESCTLI